MEAELVFWKPLAEPLEPLDFTKPGSEKKFEDLDRLNESHSVLIKDIRGQESSFSLEQNGFAYVDHEVPDLKGCKGDDEVKELLIPLTEKLVQDVTGAYKTITLTSRVRSLAEDSSKRADNRAPAHSVHTDFTPAGALQQLSMVLPNHPDAERLKSSRIMIINVWRPLKDIKKDPLAVCNWASVDTKDIVPNRMIFKPGFWNELGKVNWNDKQQWYTMKGQTPAEPLLFKQFDSKWVEQGGMTVPHSAFVDPEFADEEARESIEIKMFAFVDE